MATTRPEWLRSPRTIVPGLMACMALAGGGFVLQTLFERMSNFVLLEALVIALVAGMAWRHFAGPKAKNLLPGAKFAAKELLEFAIVILGCSVDFNLIFKSGPLLIGTACALVVAVISLATILGQRLGLNRKTSLLIGVGNGICGNSAIAAVAPLIEAESADVAASIGFTAIASVVLVLLLPLLPKVVPLSFTQYGVVAGLTVYAVPQVLAAAYPVSAESVAIATLAKLTRVLFLSPVVMFFAVFGKAKESREKFSAKKLFPWFLVGFFIFAGLRTLNIINIAWADRMREIGKVCTMLAMGGIGLSVDLRALRGSSRKVILTVGLTLLFMVVFAVVFAKNAFAAELLVEHSSRPLQAESSMEALEAWETPISGFFVRSHFDIPAVDVAAWRLVIDGLVEHPISISLRDLMRLPSVTSHSVLECSGNGRGLQQPTVPGVQWRRGAVGNAEWTGVSINELLKRAGVKPFRGHG